MQKASFLTLLKSLQSKATTNFVKNYKNFEVFKSALNSIEHKNLVFTCEHASNNLPDEYSWSRNEIEKFESSHWAYDIKAWDLTRELIIKMKATGFRSKYSRLLCDVNRPVTSDTLFRKDADKERIDLNCFLPNEEEKRRLENYYYSYYDGLRDYAKNTDFNMVVSIHSFTPVYEGQKREVEVGILTSFHDELGLKLLEKFQKKGYKAALNEPWSGKEGLCYANDSLILAKRPMRQGVMVEFRNDLLLDDKKFTAILNDFSQFLGEIIEENKSIEEQKKKEKE